MTADRAKQTLVHGMVAPVLCLGITGHRKLANAVAVRTRLDDALVQLKLLGDTELSDAASGMGLPTPKLQLRLYSPLAEGADRIAAEATLAKGGALQCPLPFLQEDYETDFTAPDSKAAFRELLGQAERVFQLDGRPDEREAAYLEVGRLVLRHADLLIAVWDGQAARGVGGTAQIIAEARANKIPVIWIKADGSEPAGLLVGPIDKPEALSLLSLEDAIEKVLSPPKTTATPSPLTTYLRERMLWPFAHWFDNFVNLILLRPRWRWWPMGERDFGRSGEFWDAPVEGHAALQLICRPCFEADVTQAYARADVFATYYAGLYRTTFLLNFLLSAGAVGLAVATSRFKDREGAVVGELIIILTIIALTLAANWGHWHERWIGYRRLAEQIRPLRILFPLGLVRPHLSATHPATGEEQNRWIDWLTWRIERVLGLPDVAVTQDYLFAARRFTVRSVLDEQIDYHERNVTKLAQVDERLHLTGMLLFGATLLICVVEFLEHPVAWAPLEHFHWDRSSVLLALSGVMPAIGSALLGIRNVGEFARLEMRSKSMAEGLKRRRDVLEEVPEGPLSRAELSLQLEDFASELSAETQNWRTLLITRHIELPG